MAAVTESFLSSGEHAVAAREELKVCRLSAGRRWIRTSGSVRDKGSVPRFRLAPELMATDGSRR